MYMCWSWSGLVMMIIQITSFHNACTKCRTLFYAGADPGFVVREGVSRRGVWGPHTVPQRVVGRALVGLLSPFPVVFSGYSDPVSATNKTDCDDIAEILLNMALNTINQPNLPLPLKYNTKLWGFEELQTFNWTTILNQPHHFYQTKKLLV